MCEEGGVTIAGEYFICRRYVTEAKKYVISNCPPELTDEQLKQILLPYGRVVSEPTRLRVSTAHEDLRHIKTWRRSVYIMTPQNSTEMPKRLLITATDGAKQTLYIDKDEIVCGFCYALGHQTDRCRKKIENERDFPEFNVPIVNRLHVQKNNSAAITPPVITATTDLMPVFSNGSTSEKPQEKTTKDTRQEEAASNQEPQPTSQEPSISIWGDNLAVVSSPTNNKENQVITAQEKNTDNDMEVTKRTSFFNMTEKDIQEMDVSDWNDPKFTSTKLPVPKETKSKRVLSPDSPENKDPKVKRRYQEEIDNQSETSEAESISSCTSRESQSSTKTSKRSPSELIALNTVIDTMNFPPTGISEEDFRNFFTQCRGKANAKKIAPKYTNNLSDLIRKLDQAATLSTNFNLQRRFQRAAQALRPSNEN
jgi:hypothetical protein